MATKKANPAYRKTTRNGIPVYVSTTTGRVVKGPAGVKRSARKLAGAVKRTVRRAVRVGVKRVKAAIKRNPSTYVTLDTARSKGAAYAKQGLTKQSAWEKFIAWSRIRSFSPPLPADSHKRLRIKEEFVKAWEGAVKNPKATYSGLVVAATSTSRSHLAARATALPFYSSIHKRGERYSLLVQPHNLVQAKRLIKDPPWQDVKNPKAKKVTAKRKTAPRVGQSGTLVGKSKHLATMQAAQKLMPFPGAQVIQGGDQTKANTYYYLKVPSKNVAMARKILNGMAKTMTKKK